MTQHGISDVAAEGTFSTGPYVLSDTFLARIKAAYRAGLAETAFHPGSEVWRTIAARSIAIHRALLGDDDNACRELLSNPAASSLFYGFDNLFDDESAAISKDASLRIRRVSELNYSLSVLSGALGCRIENMEYGERHWTNELRPPTADACIVAIDTFVGSVDFPNPFPHEHGIATTRGIISCRAIHAIYQAWRTKQVTERAGPRVVEVGGGLGRAAYYSALLGVTDYTILDLPLTSVAQALFLGHTLGEHRVTLAGEGRRKGAVALLPPSSARNVSVDLLVNVDSITEMSRSEADDYALAARRERATVLSINHEANQHTAAEVFGSMRRDSRSPYWLRPGYVEEVYTAPRRRWL